MNRAEHWSVRNRGTGAERTQGARKWRTSPAITALAAIQQMHGRGTFRGANTVGVSARMAPCSPISPMLTSSQRLRPAQRTRGGPPSSAVTSKLRSGRACRASAACQSGCTFFMSLPFPM